MLLLEVLEDWSVYRGFACQSTGHWSLNGVVVLVWSDMIMLSMPPTGLLSSPNRAGSPSLSGVVYGHLFSDKFTRCVHQSELSCIDPFLIQIRFKNVDSLLSDLLKGSEDPTKC